MNICHAHDLFHIVSKNMEDNIVASVLAFLYYGEGNHAPSINLWMGIGRVMYNSLNAQARQIFLVIH